MGIDWYWLRPLEGQLFDYARYVGGAEDHTGEEALRRDEYEHGVWMQERAFGARWVPPLMELICSNMKKKTPRPTDIFERTRGLILSARAREVLEQLAGHQVEFLPVGTPDGIPLFWLRAPVVPAALDRERSRLTMLRDEIRSIDQPVMRRDTVPRDTGFISLHPVHATPALSAKVVEAIRAADLYGAEYRAIEMV